MCVVVSSLRALPYKTTSYNQTSPYNCMYDFPSKSITELAYLFCLLLGYIENAFSNLWPTKDTNIAFLSEEQV
jgi:hypothetical protein